LIVIGLVIVAVGLLWPCSGVSASDGLPAIFFDNFTVYLPIATGGLLISLSCR
jgi:hypothetical protein